MHIFKNSAPTLRTNFTKLRILLLALSFLVASYTPVFAEPQITSISSASGPTAGGELVTLHGLDFLENEKIIQTTISSYTPNAFSALTSEGRVFTISINFRDYSIIATFDLSDYFEGESVQQISTDSNGSNFYALSNSGKIFHWQLDNPGDRLAQTPTDITDSTFSGVSIAQISDSGNTPIFISDDNKIYYLDWQGTLTTLGTLPSDETIKAVAFPYFFTNSGDVISLDGNRLSGSIANEQFADLFTGHCGNYYVSTTNGKTYAWGDNRASSGFYNAYQLGNGDLSSVPFSNPIDLSSAFNHEKIRSLTGHYCQSAALTESGKIFTWGGGSDVSTPSNTRFGLGEITFQSLASSFYWNPMTPFFAKATDGRIFAWGNNAYGQFGTGEADNSVNAIDVSAFFPQNIELQTIHYMHTSVHPVFGLTTSGELYAWGDNQKTNGAIGSLDPNNPNRFLTPFNFSKTFNLQTLPAVTAISFGNTEVTDFEIIDASTIRLNVPAHNAGHVPVVLTTKSGQSAMLQSGYTYLDEITPNSDAQTKSLGQTPTNPQTLDQNPTPLILLGSFTLALAVFIARRLTVRH